jgi:glycosyltransferase involved in cell wall biosynthesis
VRIGIDGRPLLRPHTGVETYLSQALQQMVVLEPSNSYRVLLDAKAPETPVWPEVCSAVSIRPSRMIPRSLMDGWMLWDVPQYLRHEKMDCFFSASTKFPPGGCPTVVTVHDLGWRYVPEVYTKREVVKQWLWQAASARWADRLVAVSDATRRDLVRAFPRTIDRVRVIPEGVSPIFCPLPRTWEIISTLERYKINGSYVITVGTISPKKNLCRLLQAHARLLERGGWDRTLVVVGKLGWRSEEITRELRRAGVRERVRYIGYIPDEDLVRLYNGADAFVYASLYEGFGLPVLEAMACGVPVVTSRVGSLPEVAGDAAYFVDPLSVDSIAQGLWDVVRDAVMRRHLVVLGLARAQQFSWRRLATGLLEVCAEIGR